MRFSGNRYATAKRLRRHHGPVMAAWWAAEHGSSHPPGSEEREFWFSVHEILRKADRLLQKKKIRHHPGSVRAAIKSWGRFGHIKRNPPLTLDEAYEKAWAAWPTVQKILATDPDVSCVAFSPYDAINGRFYNLRKLPGLSSPISIGVHTGHFSFGGRFIPDRPEDMPAWVKIKFPFLTFGKTLIMQWPMFAHEFTHALQWESTGDFQPTYGDSIESYWNNPREFFAYQITIRAFVQQELEIIFKSKAGAKTASKKFKAIFKSPHVDIEGFKHYTPENAKRMLDYFDSLKNGATVAFVDRYKTLPE